MTFFNKMDKISDTKITRIKINIIEFICSYDCLIKRIDHVKYLQKIYIYIYTTKLSYNITLSVINNLVFIYLCVYMYRDKDKYLIISF